MYLDCKSLHTLKQREDSALPLSDSCPTRSLIASLTPLPNHSSYFSKKSGGDLECVDSHRSAGGGLRFLFSSAWDPILKAASSSPVTRPYRYAGCLLPNHFYSLENHMICIFCLCILFFFDWFFLLLSQHHQNGCKRFLGQALHIACLWSLTQCCTY